MSRRFMCRTVIIGPCCAAFFLTRDRFGAPEIWAFDALFARAIRAKQTARAAPRASRARSKSRPDPADRPPPRLPPPPLRPYAGDQLLDLLDERRAVVALELG